MSECRRIGESLTAYADDLLEPAERSGVERHLAACPACRRQADKEHGARRLLRQSSPQLLNETLPPGLRTRCEALARERFGHSTSARFGPWWRVRLVPVLLTVVVMIFGASAFLLVATRRSDTLLAAQLTADQFQVLQVSGTA